MEIYSCQANALDTTLISIESELTRGFSGLQLIGNVSEVCKNGIERAKTALENLELILPQKRIVVSMAPASLKKDGSQFDLALAIALASLVKDSMPNIDLSKWMFISELSLTGELKPVKSIISYTLAAVYHGFQGIVICHKNLSEVRSLTQFKINGMEQFSIKSFNHLNEVLQWLYEQIDFPSISSEINTFADKSTQLNTQILGKNFDDMLLDQNLELAAKITAVGMHSLFLTGTPGSGKSMFAERLPSIMPNMTESEHLEALMISSSCHEKIPKALLAGRAPFRAPHHNATTAAILGTPKIPGELSMAHGGILFLDEFPEFRRDIIEALREPLENGSVHVSRAKSKVSWNARVCLVAAANNCPCGWCGSTVKKCHCPTNKILSYRRKISGPIMERIDIHIHMKEPSTQNSDVFTNTKSLKKSITSFMADDVQNALEFSKRRNKSLSIQFNRDLEAKHMIFASGLNESEFVHLINHMIPKTLSRRSLIRCLRVARSLADLQLKNKISEIDISTALSWQAEAAAKARGDFNSGIY